MKRLRIGPGGKLGDRIDLAKEFADFLARVVTLAQRVEVGHHPTDGILHLGDRRVRKILTLLFEAAMVLEKFLAEELSETRAGWPAQRTRETWNVEGSQTTLRGHQ